MPVQAQLFADDEARRAIIELRNRLTQIDARQTQNEARQTQTEARQAELSALNARVDGLARAQLDNASGAETLRRDIAQIRGAVEQLTQQVKVSEDQQRKATQPLEAQLQAIAAQLQALTDRVQALEPQAVVLDDQRIMVPAVEKAAFEAAQSLLASRAIEAGAAAFSEFNTRFPVSALAPWALSFEGAAYYALKNYPLAIQALSRLSKDHPSHGRTADGLLTLAASQAESGQTAAARTTLSSIPKRFPGSAAARTASQRLKALPTTGSK